MIKQNILIFGGSEHARTTIDIIEQTNTFNIVGIIDSTLKKGSNVSGYKVLGNLFDLPEISIKNKVDKGIIAIGDNYIRKKIVEQIKMIAPHFSYVSAIHPSVIIGKNVSIGDGTVIIAGVIINNDSIVGEHCYLSTRSSLDHDCHLGDFSSLSPNVATGGNVKIGYCSAIGIGVNILHGRTIGDHTIVGSGSLVYQDFGDNMVCYGVPAKLVRKREEGDKYL